MGQLIVLIVRSSIRDDFNQVHSHPFLNPIQRISESISVFKKCVTIQINQCWAEMKFILS